MPTPHPRARLLCAALLAATPPALADTKTWNIANGNWSNPAAWSPSGVPAALDTVKLLNPTAFDFNVTYDVNPPYVLAALTVSHSNTLLASSANLLLNTNVTLGANAEFIGDSRAGGQKGYGSIAHSAGLNNINTPGSQLLLGYLPTDIGTYNLSGTGSVTLAPNAQLDVGYNGTGIFNQSAGTALVGTSGETNLGYYAGATGTYNLTGGTLTTPRLNIGNGGNGIFNHTAGFLKTGSIYISNSPSAAGTLTISSNQAGLQTDALLVGSQATGNYLQSAGFVTVNTIMNVGPFSNPNASTAQLSNGFLIVEELNVQAGGTFSLSGGRLNPHSLYVGATFNLSGGELTQLSNAYTDGKTYINSQNFTQSGGYFRTPNLFLNFTTTPAPGTARYTMQGGSLIADAAAIGSNYSLNSFTYFDQSQGFFQSTRLEVGANGVHAFLNLSGGITTAGSITLGNVNLLDVSAITLTNHATLIVGGLNLIDTLHLDGGTCILNGPLTFTPYSSGGNFGKIDITLGKLIVQTGNTPDKLARASALLALITEGKNGGNWQGHGITSALAAADPAHKTVVLVDNAFLHLTTVNNQYVDDNSLLLQTTYYGDANLDRIVNVSDLGTLATHYGQPTAKGILDGDFNQDGLVNVSDLGLLATNYGQGTNGQPFPLDSPQSPSANYPIQSTPEPASLPLLAAGLFLASRRQSPRPPRSPL